MVLGGLEGVKRGVRVCCVWTIWLNEALHGPSRVEGRLGLVIRVSGPGRADMRLIALLPTFLCTWELEAMHPFKWRTLLGNPIPTLK